MIFEFVRPDGKWIQREFPCGKCPPEVIDDDGVKAERGWRTAPDVSWKSGQESPSAKQRINDDIRRRNDAAGEKGKADWQHRMPKLKYDFPSR